MAMVAAPVVGPLLTVITIIIVIISLSSRAEARTYRSGFPKFPARCGSRLVAWSPQREPRIIGGEVPPYGAVPWQVDIRIDGAHHCGGTIIANRLILTAAHCCQDNLTVTTGTQGPHTDFEQSLKVLKAIKHPDFRRDGPYSNDIALVLVEDPGFTYNAVVQPVCLAEESPQPGTWCEVSGWGAMDPSDPERISPILRSAAVPLISLDTCRQSGIYGGRQQPILDSMLCAGRLKGGVDACGGDSGGPLVCNLDGNLELAGIVSWGDGCAKRDRPGVYTRISSYRKWIREAAQNLGIHFI
ncbi:PREDICTED: brain-specific serine protease 4-like [Nicrophorus vespilloides]|uniref:Brain-specific serine protease 4-like n=1 Tax=Nicrophorus vespilloides TaxID=110193 RepID=A0ABM1MJ16_NICVS|nr:PREDICTED: brain-specific serine protease 4-like [Nicrophorus vespilloides]